MGRWGHPSSPNANSSHSRLWPLARLCVTLGSRLFGFRKSEFRIELPARVPVTHHSLWRASIQSQRLSIL
ncbi:hypothetical protein K1719_037077 [Acacia pycnantha]|nr:hypothetical protein K1719_037077 [Acacia pycnantha]